MLRPAMELILVGQMFRLCESSRQLVRRWSAQARSLRESFGLWLIGRSDREDEIQGVLRMEGIYKSYKERCGWRVYTCRASSAVGGGCMQVEQGVLKHRRRARVRLHVELAIDERW